MARFPLLLALLLPAAPLFAQPKPSPKPAHAKPSARPQAPAAPEESDEEEEEEVSASTSAAPGASGEDEEEDPGSFSPSVELGITGSMGQESNSEDYNWGPKLSVDIACTPKRHPFVFSYGMEASYDDAETKLTTADTESRSRTRFADIRYAKISFLRLFGYDVPKLGFTPYVATGAQYADTYTQEKVKSDPGDPDEVTVTRDRYWSSTWGFGAEVPIGSRATLVLDVDQNTRGGLRYYRRLSLELKFRVLGDGE